MNIHKRKTNAGRRKIYATIETTKGSITYSLSSQKHLSS